MDLYLILVLLMDYKNMQLKVTSFKLKKNAYQIQ